MLTRLTVIGALLLAICAGGSPQVTAAAPPDDAAILHALNRLTYGPRPGDVERVKAIGLRNGSSCS
jgi:hypothetical protein